MTISRNLAALAQYVASGGILGQASSLPSQATNSGKFLTTNGTAASWGTVSGIDYLDGGTPSSNYGGTTAIDGGTP